MFKAIKKWLQYRRIMKKVRSEIPYYRPNGNKLDWKITIHVPMTRANQHTGYRRQTGLATLHFKQIPNNIRIDERVWRLDHRKGRMYEDKARWR